jgi:gliotoxin/aspirochlorine/mycotoxins biosynthesis cytochrome P450 monooxygenase
VAAACRLSLFTSVITTPEDVKNFYSDSQNHRKAHAINAGWLFQQLLGDCLGLINGPRWAQLRNVLEHTGFDRQAAQSRLTNAATLAREHVEKWSSTSGSSGRISIDASAATAPFPLFYTAQCIYGELSKSQEAGIWALNQRRAALMRFVVRGGIYRSPLSCLLDRAMHRELLAFQQDWHQFNIRAYNMCCQSEKEPRAMIRNLWEYGLQSLVARTKVCVVLSSGCLGV